MKEVHLTKQLNGSFIPDTDADKEALKRFKVGETLKAKITKPRNPKFHRKFFALLNLTFENQNKYSEFEHFRKYVICCTGRYDEIETKKGTIVLPHSISFGKMDELQFSELYESALNVCAIILEVSTKDLDTEVGNKIQNLLHDFH